MAIQIVKYGTPVITVIGNIKALITAVCIRDQHMEYEVSYFQSGSHVHVWLQRIEFEIDDTEKVKPGLVHYNNKQNETFTLIE